MRHQATVGQAGCERRCGDEGHDARTHRDWTGQPCGLDEGGADEPGCHAHDDDHRGDPSKDVAHRVSRRATALAGGRDVVAVHGCIVMTETECQEERT